MSPKDITDAPLRTPSSPPKGYSIDSPGLDDEDEDDDELALAALDSLDEIQVYKVETKPPVAGSQARIPTENWRKLLTYLLVLAPLGPQESLAHIAERLTGPRLQSLQRVADHVLAAFDPAPAGGGITHAAFAAALAHTLPHLFAPLGPLFEHFLFSRNLDLSRHRGGAASAPLHPAPSIAPPPLLPAETEILDAHVLGQLAAFLPRDELFHRLRPLYAGADDGFSINALAQKVLNWDAPSLLLVAGPRLPAQPADAPTRAFLESLPHARIPAATEGGPGARVVFGAMLYTPWKTTHASPAGDERTVLFQLAPTHDVLPASRLNRDYLTFNRDGLGLGVPPPPAQRRSSTGHAAAAGSTIALGPVSLALDTNLAYGVFNHEVSGGGAFGTSRVRPGRDWRELFEVESLEVWGLGGADAAAKQREAWLFEEREAARRRGLNLGRDREADYALLEMAGLVGGHGNSGGSMG